jgi:uncharacterized protein (TIGR01777 family)
MAAMTEGASRDPASMKTVLVSGASGLIGGALVPELERAGHRVLRLVRRETRNANELRWTPAAHLFDERQLAGVDLIVNLAGEPIGRRWTSTRRRRIRDSRVAGTDAIATAIGKAGKGPLTLINASAVGFYGDRGDETLDEGSGAGRGFLAEICKQWEAATKPAAQQGSRVVMMRSGVVLSARGGAIAKMRLPFRLGIGGRLGSGRQWLSWIGLDDMVRAIVWLIDHPEISGPVNMTAPDPVTNAEFTKAMGRAMHRPTFLPVPGFALRLIFGEMAEETLLASQRAVPSVLLKSGFEFQQPTIDGALQSL